MAKFDRHTFVVVLEAIISCSEADPVAVENYTGYKLKDFEILQRKYNSLNEYEIDAVDLPKVIKALEWMLVIKDDSDILQVHREDGLRLVELLKQGKSEIKESTWSLFSV